MHFQKHFFDGNTYKADIGQHFDKSEKNAPGWCHHPQTAEIFSIADNSTTLTPPGPPGVSKEAKSSTEFEFGDLAKIGPKIKKRFLTGF